MNENVLVESIELGPILGQQLNIFFQATHFWSAIRRATLRLMVAGL